MKESIRNWGAAAGLGLMVGVGALSLAADVQACPRQDVYTTYYSDASHTVEVGESILLCNCGGRKRWGLITPYYHVDSYPCD
jgi:hypothetical protein